MDYIIWIIAIFVVLDLLFVIYVFFRGKKKLSATDRRKYLQYWNSIKSDKDNAHAIINADKLLDKLLTAKGFHGSVGDKLKKANNVFMNIDDVWSAHKLRNRIAHEIGHTITEKQRKTALKQFEAAFKDLGLF